MGLEIDLLQEIGRCLVDQEVKTERDEQGPSQGDKLDPEIELVQNLEVGDQRKDEGKEEDEEDEEEDG